MKELQKQQDGRFICSVCRLDVFDVNCRHVPGLYYRLGTPGAVPRGTPGSRECQTLPESVIVGGFRSG
jgi:hypothetical protein